MPNFSTENFKILFDAKWPTTGLSENISRIDRRILQREYRELKRIAPRRWSQQKKYFVGEHDGNLSMVGGSNRFEEHLAIALWRLAGLWSRPGGGAFRLLDYQFPLRAQQSDEGIGEVDLLGITDRGRLAVIELKVKPEGSTSRGESPAAALFQGLRYAAIVDANRAEIAKEAKLRFDANIVEEAPIVQIFAPKAWWNGWMQLGGSTRKAAGHWEPEFAKLTRNVEALLGVAVECVALDNLRPENIGYGSNGRQPQIDGAPALYPVRLGEASAIGRAVPSFRRDA